LSHTGKREKNLLRHTGTRGRIIEAHWDKRGKYPVGLHQIVTLRHSGTRGTLMKIHSEEKTHSYQRNNYSENLDFGINHFSTTLHT
jgi:hypothetical protein